jgi:hypothetical protein
MEVKCGDANPKGNVQLTHKGGCRGKLDIKDAYRCTGCDSWFHKECILNHFELEQDHDWGRQKERERCEKILAQVIDDLYLDYKDDFAGYEKGIEDAIRH